MKKYTSPKIFVYKLHYNILQGSNINVTFDTSLNKEYEDADNFYEIEF